MLFQSYHISKKGAYIHEGNLKHVASGYGQGKGRGIKTK